MNTHHSVILAVKELRLSYGGSLSGRAWLDHHPTPLGQRAVVSVPRMGEWFASSNAM